jgi:hypothetical protein
MRNGCLTALALVLGSCVGAAATDQPIVAEELSMRAGARGRLVFVSHDPHLLVPAVGSADDPTTGTPGGCLVELFTHAGTHGTLAIPPGLGKPGWRILTQGTPTYLYQNRQAPSGPSPVRAMTLNARVLRIEAKAPGLPLDAPAGSVGIRITLGTLRSCALFAAGEVKRDEAGQFLGIGANTDVLRSCSDAALSATFCGDSAAPACDGLCPPGFACASVDPATCACISSP